MYKPTRNQFESFETAQHLLTEVLETNETWLAYVAQPASATEEEPDIDDEALVLERELSSYQRDLIAQLGSIVARTTSRRLGGLAEATGNAWPLPLAMYKHDSRSIGVLAIAGPADDPRSTHQSLNIIRTLEQAEAKEAENRALQQAEAEKVELLSIKKRTLTPGVSKRIAELLVSLDDPAKRIPYSPRALARHVFQTDNPTPNQVQSIRNRVNSPQLPETLEKMGFSLNKMAADPKRGPRGGVLVYAERAPISEVANARLLDDAERAELVKKQIQAEMQICVDNMIISMKRLRAQPYSVVQKALDVTREQITQIISNFYDSTNEEDVQNLRNNTMGLDKRILLAYYKKNVNKLADQDFKTLSLVVANEIYNQRRSNRYSKRKR